MAPAAGMSVTLIEGWALEQGARLAGPEGSLSRHCGAGIRPHGLAHYRLTSHSLPVPTGQEPSPTTSFLPPAGCCWAVLKEVGLVSWFVKAAIPTAVAPCTGLAGGEHLDM